MLHILSLSLELLRNVASYLDITDFAALALSCPELYQQLLSNERYNEDIIQVSNRHVQSPAFDLSLLLDIAFAKSAFAFFMLNELHLATSVRKATNLFNAHFCCYSTSSVPATVCLLWMQPVAKHYSMRESEGIDRQAGLRSSFERGATCTEGSFKIRQSY